MANYTTTVEIDLELAYHDLEAEDQKQFLIDMFYDLDKEDMVEVTREDIDHMDFEQGIDITVQTFEQMDGIDRKETLHRMIGAMSDLERDELMDFLKEGEA